MDADATLADIIAGLEAYFAQDSDDDRADVKDKLATDLESLASWIRRGGFVPTLPTRLYAR